MSRMFTHEKVDYALREIIGLLQKFNNFINLAEKNPKEAKKQVGGQET